MNKYLQKRLEEAHLNPVIENLVFLISELLRNNPSDAFEEFMNEDVKDIVEALGWKADDKVKKVIETEIEDKALASLMVRNERDGFLAEVHFEAPRNIKFGDNGDVQGWISGGIYIVHWVYAHSIGELIENILERDELVYQESVAKAKAEAAE